MCCLGADTYSISLVFPLLMHAVSCSAVCSTLLIINFSGQSHCTLSSRWWIPLLRFTNLHHSFLWCTVCWKVFLFSRDCALSQQPWGPHLQERWSQVEQDPWTEGAQWAGDRWDTLTHKLINSQSFYINLPQTQAPKTTVRTKRPVL